MPTQRKDALSASGLCQTTSRRPRRFPANATGDAARHRTHRLACRLTLQQLPGIAVHNVLSRVGTLRVGQIECLAGASLPGNDIGVAQIERTSDGWQADEEVAVALVDAAAVMEVEVPRAVHIAVLTAPQLHPTAIRARKSGA